MISKMQRAEQRLVSVEDTRELIVPRTARRALLIGGTLVASYIGIVILVQFWLT